MVDTILLIIGLICLGLAALGVSARLNLGWLGLLFLYLRELI